MATLTRINPESATSPLARWHLLSLDAPSIAALWTWFIAWSSHLHVSLLSPLAMFLAVWVLYAADRLLDARTLAPASRSSRSSPAPSDLDLEARHVFHARHRTGFLRAICAGCIALGVLVPELPPAALRLDALLGAILAGYFVLIHATPAARRLPKEIAVGIFFSAAVFIPAIACEPALRGPLLPSALLFAALCSVNCLCIYSWEHRDLSSRFAISLGDRLSREPHAATRLALTHLRRLHLLLLSLALFIAAFQRQPVALAIALAAGTLLVVDVLHLRLARVDLRAAADLALATPLIVAPLLLFLHRLRP